MTEQNMDATMQWYDGLLESVRQVAMSPEEQTAKLSGFVVTDEIASDFSDLGMEYAKKLLACEWITQAHFELAERIDQTLEEMSRNKELWEEEALFLREEWDACRKMGRTLLEMLEHP